MKYFLSLFMAFILFSCANQTAPTGGPRDEDPPELLSSSPNNQDINVETNKIELNFDEYIKLNKPSEQIIISPRIDNEIEYTYRKDIVIIRFENPLPDSTTFTINFREGVQDITEGNSPEDLKIAFSTGNYLDSLYITGFVTDLLTGEQVKDYSIFLYDCTDTLNIFEDPPLYFTKTSNNGNFALENIKAGVYDIYAVQDNNKNLQLDFKSESYAFLDSTLTLQNTSIDSLKLQAYFLNPSPMTLRSARQNGTIFEVKYDKFISTFSLQTVDSSFLYANFLDDLHRSIVIYQPSFKIDSLETYIQVKDSLGYTRRDTVLIKFQETVRKSKGFKSDIKLEKIFPSIALLEGNLTFNKPITSYTFDSLYIFLDSANIVYIDTTEVLKSSQYKDSFTLNYKIDKSLFSTDAEEQEKTSQTETTSDTTANEASNKSQAPKPHLYIGRGAFISVDSDSIPQQVIDLQFTKAEDYATLFIDVETTQSSFIIQLLNTKYELIQQSVSQHNFSFANISPGDYYIRIIRDKNNNGLWDTGDIYTRSLPEPIAIYESDEGTRKIVLRANWETPITIEF